MLRLARCRATGIVLGILLATNACTDSSSTGPSGGQISLAQRAALTSLMTRQSVASSMWSGSAASGYSAALLPLIAMNIQEVGHFTVTASSGDGDGSPPSGEYSAFGGQFLVTLTPVTGAAIHLVWTGVIGVNDLTNPTDVITVGVIDDGSTSAPASIPSTAFGASGVRSAVSSYIHLNGETASSFSGNSGQVALTGISFSTGNACPGVELIPQVKTCDYSSGTLQGNFGFTGKLVGGTTTVAIPATTLNVPATRVKLWVDLSGQN